MRSLQMLVDFPFLSELYILEFIPPHIAMESTAFPRESFFCMINRLKDSSIRNFWLTCLTTRNELIVTLARKRSERSKCTYGKSPLVFLTMRFLTSEMLRLLQHSFAICEDFYSQKVTSNVVRISREIPNIEHHYMRSLVWNLKKCSYLKLQL